MSLLVWVVLILLLGMPGPALAYLDSATPNMVLQFVVAGIVAISVAPRHFSGRHPEAIVSVFRRPSPQSPRKDDGSG